MVTAIQPRTAPVAPTPSFGGGQAVSEAASPVIEPVPSSPVTPPAKAVIQVDTEGMRKNLEEAINRINDMMRDGGRGLNFSIDNAVGGPVVQVRNLESGEVIRQIPNEVVVKVAHSIEDLKGLLHNEAA